jgi:hypothetical protein
MLGKGLAKIVEISIRRYVGMYIGYDLPGAAARVKGH